MTHVSRLFWVHFVCFATLPVFLFAQHPTGEGSILRVSSAPLWIPAPSGTAAETLGRGLDHTLSEFDATGKRSVVYTGKNRKDVKKPSGFLHENAQWLFALHNKHSKKK